MKSPTAVLAASACLLAVQSLTFAAQAQTATEFFNNRQMTMVIGTTVGGGYDIFGRMFARHMGKYLPGGNARFAVKNMPGAGGLVATNHMFNVAERDGSTIAVVSRETLTEPLLSTERTQAKFDPRRFVWLGSPNLEVGMIYVSTASRVRSIADAQQREATLGTSSGANSTGVTVPKLLNVLIGTKFKVITGYPGSMESILAMERNEVDGRYSPGWAGPEANKVNDLVVVGKARLIVYLSPDDSPAFKDLPNVMGLATTPEYKQILGVVLSNQGLGRPLAHALARFRFAPDQTCENLFIAELDRPFLDPRIPPRRRHRRLHVALRRTAVHGLSARLSTERPRRRAVPDRRDRRRPFRLRHREADV